MSDGQSPSTSSSPLPRDDSNELINDNDSVGTRNGEETNIDIYEGPDQYEERFRVDRRKLEQMLHGK